MHADLAKHVRGCLLAGAIGDAMGGPFEGQVGPIRYRDHAPWNISDETQLTLATCEAITEAGGVSPERIAARFLVWHRQRRITGTGASTLKALRDLEAGGHWALSGAKGEMSAGNGAAMRIAPLAFLLNPANARDRQTIRDVCRITHHHEESYMGALAIIGAIRTTSIETLFSDLIDLLPDSRVRDRLIEFAALPENNTISDVASRFGTSGYVVESVPLALFAAQFIDRMSLEDILRSVIEAGGDTDTNASITGHIAGAWCDETQVPTELVSRLPDVAEIEAVIHDFNLTVVSGTN